MNNSNYSCAPMYNQNNNNQVMGYMCSNTKNVENFNSPKNVENFGWWSFPPPMQAPPPSPPPTIFKKAVVSVFGNNSYTSWMR
jgi:hypothetical protein